MSNLIPQENEQLIEERTTTRRYIVEVNQPSNSDPASVSGVPILVWLLFLIIPILGLASISNNGK